MGVFEFVIILVAIGTLGKAAVAVGGPLLDQTGEYLRASAAERRARRERLESGATLSPDTVEELERRLTRIEDRLDFLEELRAPTERKALHGSPAHPAAGERDGPAA